MPSVSSFVDSSQRGVLLLALSLAAAGSGCAALGPRLENAAVDQRAVELNALPFYPQDDDQSAPSALATILRAQQIAVQPDDLIKQFHGPSHEGALQPEVIAATRSYGLVPYVVHSPQLDLDVVREVQAGHPVLVLLNSGFSFAQRWHFAVVIGVDPPANSLTLRTGSKARELVSFGEFRNSWRDSGYWAMVASRPEELPVTADPQHWREASEPFVQIGKAEVAERAFNAATQRWPDDTSLWEGLANARHLQQDFRGTSAALMKALELAPQNTVARHNFAYALLERNCAEQAEQQIDQAIAAEPDPQKLDIFQRTRRLILKHDGPSVVCPGI